MAYYTLQTDNEENTSDLDANDSIHRHTEQTHVANWQQLYDDTYHQDSSTTTDNHINTFDISGWHSSFTGAAIPEIEMREWVDCTVARIQQLNPCRLLEIGSGSGLLFYPLQANCEYYRVTDLSEQAINRLKQAVVTQGLDKQVNCQVCEAASIANHCPPGSVDTVIINSVVQYFPGMNYLRQVIDGALAALTNRGTIFLGDIRDYRLLNAFHLALLMFQKPDESVDSIIKQARWHALQDNELLISPDYFLALQQEIPAIAKVELLPNVTFRTI